MSRLLFPFPVILVLTACSNFGVVDEGRLYRTAQLSPNALSKLIKEHRIQCVLNLRGADTEEDWYLEEVAVCQRLGVTHRSVRWSATRWPKVEEIRAVLDVMEQGPWPMMVHCRGGADRVGLMSTLYRLTRLAEPSEDADDSLTLWHGHVGWLGGTGELDEFVELYRTTGEGRKPFREWLIEDYDRERGRLLAE